MSSIPKIVIVVGLKDNKYYIEQPYNGIYETSLDAFKTIEEISK